MYISSGTAPKTTFLPQKVQAQRRLKSVRSLTATQYQLLRKNSEECEDILSVTDTETDENEVF